MSPLATSGAAGFSFKACPEILRGTPPIDRVPKFDKDPVSAYLLCHGIPSQNALLSVRHFAGEWGDASD